MDIGHDSHPFLAFLKDRPGLLILEITGLKTQQARNNLEIVLHPVVDLLEHRLLLTKGSLNLLLGFFCLFKNMAVSTPPIMHAMRKEIRTKRA